MDSCITPGKEEERFQSAKTIFTSNKQTVAKKSSQRYSKSPDSEMQIQGRLLNFTYNSSILGMTLEIGSESKIRNSLTGVEDSLGDSVILGSSAASIPKKMIEDLINNDQSTMPVLGTSSVSLYCEACQSIVQTELVSQKKGIFTRMFNSLCCHKKHTSHVCPKCKNVLGSVS